MKNFFKAFFLFFAITLFALVNLYSQENPARGYIQNISIDYSEPNIVYAAVIGQGLMKSENYGESWAQICDKAYKNEFHVVKVDPKNSGRILAGGERSGLLLSTDKGKTWQSVGLKDVSICDIAIDETNPKRIFVLADEGIYLNENIDKSDWKLTFDRVEYVKKLTNSKRRMRFWDYSRFQKVAISPHNPNTIIIAARWEGGYHRSDDGGITWKHESVSGIYRRVDVIHFHPLDSNIIYVGTHHQGMFASYNRGKSWTPHSDGLRPQIRLPYYGAYLISGFAADKTNPGIFYSGSDYSNWKTTDGGLNWTELDKSLTCEFVRAMAVDPKNPNIVYAGSNVGLYKSTDAGKYWRSINVGLNEVKTVKSFCLKENGTSYDFALAKDYPFVYRKSEGENWKSFSWLLAEFGAKEGKDLYYDAETRKLILVTDKGNYTSNDLGYRWEGKGSEVKYLNAVSEVTEKLPELNPDTNSSYLLRISLKGNVHFNHFIVDTFYRNPPYISLQIVKEGYPFNNSVPAWQTNIDSQLIANISIPKNAIDPDKKYIIYTEVRDFQKNYKTGFKKIIFSGKQNIDIDLNEGFCLKKIR